MLSCHSRLIIGIFISRHLLYRLKSHRMFKAIGINTRIVAILRLDVVIVVISISRRRAWQRSSIRHF